MNPVKQALFSTVARRYQRNCIQTSGTESTPAQAALETGSVKGLAFALDVDDSKDAIFSTFGREHMSLHRLAVKRLIEPNSYSMWERYGCDDCVEDAYRGIECCHLLIERRAPLSTGRHDDGDAKGAVGVMLLQGPWPPGCEVHMLQLLKDYQESGLLDFTRPFEFDASNAFEGMTPLRIAADSHNAGAMKALIELDARTEEALPIGHAFQGDLVGYLKASRRDGAQETAAELAQLLMERTIASHPAPNGARPGRRAARAGL